MNSRIGISACALAIIGPAGSFAQNQTTSEGGLEEIVVTAQRRSENLQNVPIAITAISAAQLEASGINTSQDLSLVTPGLVTPQAAGYIQPHIRGVGTTSNGPGIEMPVATYIDGVYLASAPASLMTLIGIDRIEVLKGPQGTLFGRNATGGLIQVVTKDPQHDASLSSDVTYGNYQDAAFDLYATAGLTSKLAADIAVRYESQGEAWGRNLYNGQPVGRLNNDVASRTKFLFDASDTTQIRLALDYEQRTTSRDTQHTVPGYPVTFSTPFFGGPFNYGTAFDINNNVQPQNNLKAGGAALKINHDFGPVLLQSITAWRQSFFFFPLDTDQTPVDILSIDATADTQQFSQEVQLSSAHNEVLKWVTGVYYYHARDQWDPLIIGFGPSVISPVPGLPVAIIENDSQETNSIAGYAQATWEFLPGTNATAGLRYTNEDKKLAGTEEFSVAASPGPLTPIPPPGAGIPAESSFNNLSYRVALDHQFGQNILGYVSYNTGFKSGGYNLTLATNPVYQPETIRSAEIGLKSELFDKHLRLNVAGFHYDYTNIQVGRFTAGTEAIYNGAAAKIYGLDLDADYVLSPELTLSGGLSYLHDRFSSFPNADFFVPGGGCVPVAPGVPCAGNAAGNELAYSPTFTYNVTGNYRHPFSAGTLSVNVTYYHSSRFYAAPDDYLYQGDFGILNSSIMWADPGNRYSIKAWGKNLGNNVYATSLIEANQGSLRALGSPRTYGVTFGVKF
jgi:iron complex outermembrane recepter protein